MQASIWPTLDFHWSCTMYLINCCAMCSLLKSCCTINCTACNTSRIKSHAKLKYGEINILHSLRQGCTTSLWARAENSRPAGPRAGSGVLGSQNRIWQKLFRLFISAEKVEMVHFDAGMRQLVCLTENHRKYLTLEWTGTEPLTAAINFYKVHMKHQTGQFFKSTVASHVGHRHGLCRPHICCTPMA